MAELDRERCILEIPLDLLLQLLPKFLLRRVQRPSRVRAALLDRGLHDVRRNGHLRRDLRSEVRHALVDELIEVRDIRWYAQCDKRGVERDRERGRASAVRYRSRVLRDAALQPERRVFQDHVDRERLQV